MDPQQLLATLIQLSDEQQQRIANLLNRLEQQTRTLTTASQRAAQAANTLDHNGQKTALHLQAVVQQSVETTLHDTLTTLSQRAEGAFQEAGRPLLHTLAGVTKAAEETEERLQAALAETMEQLQAQREQSPAQEPPSQRSRGFDMEP